MVTKLKLSKVHQIYFIIRTDAWASRKLENGWVYDNQWSDSQKTHPRLKPYNMLNDYEKERYKDPVRESLKALLALGWTVEHSDSDGLPGSSRGGSIRRSSKPVNLILCILRVLFIIFVILHRNCKVVTQAIHSITTHTQLI